MSSIIPLPTTRVSGLLVRQRLLAQLQGDQLDLFRLQNQVSTGQRFTLPSEDAPAARRAMTLQRLIERKTQIRSNIETGQSFLKSTDVALNNVAGLLGDIRGLALGVSGTTSTDTQRQAAITEINRAIEQLVAVGNTQFRGRYLFAGSQTNVEPYSYNGAYVTYHGDNNKIQSYSNLGVLFATNATGQEVFGGISSEVLGGVDLNPEVTAETPLSALRGGRGISPNGALQISDGSNAVIVDVSRAATVGDVARLIEANPPAGRRITATITGEGLTLQLDSAGGGNLTVTEVASGKAASELGLLNTVGVLTNPLVGSDLNPMVTKTTQLDSLLGAKARTRLISPGDNNDLLIQATVNGAAYNGTTIQIVDDELLRASPGVAQGSEYAQYSAVARPAQASLRFSGPGNDLTLTATTPGTAFNNVDVVVVSDSGIGNSPTVSYNSTTKQLTIIIDDADGTTVDAVRAAIDAEGTFIASSDESAEGPGSYDGLSTIFSSDALNVRGDTGNSGGAANTLYVYVRANASNANNVAAAINAEGTFKAVIDSLDTSNISQAGSQVVSLHATAVASGGSGVPFDKSSGLRVVSGQTTYTLAFDQANTVEDLLNIINGSEAGLHAEINADGTGINVRSRLSGADLQIGENGGQTATQLGIRSFTGATRLDDLNHGVGVPTRRDAYQGDAPEVLANFTIRVNNGVGIVDLEINTAGATVQEIIDRINAHPLNNLNGVEIIAQLNASGDGIELIDAAEPFSIISGGQPQPADFLDALPSIVADFTIVASDGVGGTVDLEIDATGATTIQDVIDQINSHPLNNLNGVAITAQLNANGDGIELVDGAGDPYSILSGGQPQPTDFLDVLPNIVADFTISVSHGGGTVDLVIDTAGATIQDIIDQINAHPLNNLNGVAITAQLNADGDGIELIDGTEPLSIISGGQTQPADFLDVLPNTLNDLRVTLGSGPGAVHLDFDVSGAKTVQDVIDLINNHPENSPVPVVAARLNAVGNGIEIINLSSGAVTVSSLEGSQAAEYLGLVAPGSTTATSPTGTLSGADKRYLETPSVFTTLIRLKEALAANDLTAIERAISAIDVDLDRVTFARSEVGARQQALDVTERNLEDEDVQLRSALADELEVDLIEAISNLTARQVSLEASLRATANILQMSLLNYL